MKVFQAIHSALVAARNCEKSGNSEWQERHEEKIAVIVKEYLPSGSGFDAGTQFDIRDNMDDKRERLTFKTSFHHMDRNGSYDGWTDHSVIVVPSFSGFDLRVTGRDRDGIKEYIAETFHNELERAFAD